MNFNLNTHIPNNDFKYPYLDIKGSQVLITGGRGTLGKATANAFSSLGATVWSIDISPITSQENPLIIERQADVRDRKSLEKIQEEISKGPGLNSLINAHGVQIRTNFSDCDEETWTKLTDINLNGFYRSCQVFREAMKAKGGTIVNIGSVSGLIVSKNGTPYGIQKAAVSFMTKVIAYEWAPQVRVNAIAPTAIKSGMTDDLFNSPEYVKNKIPLIPLGRMGTKEDIAHTIIFLSSRASGLITAHTVVMDGGISLS